ncbi:MAG: hypothetical protein LIV24_00645 [Eubacterium sp.]|nr:hypothetical protein [Eubacterium sp.]
MGESNGIELGAANSLYTKHILTDVGCRSIWDDKSYSKYRDLSLQNMQLLDKVRAQCGIKFPADMEGEHWI